MRRRWPGRWSRCRSQGVLGAVPGLNSLLVEFDPLAVEAVEVARALRTRIASISAAAPTSGRRRTIPVVYGGEFGPDLEAVAAEAHLPRRGGDPPPRGERAARPVRRLRSGIRLPRRSPRRHPCSATRHATDAYAARLRGDRRRDERHLPRRPARRLAGHRQDADRRCSTPVASRPRTSSRATRVRFEPIAGAEWDRYAAAPDDW